MLNANTVEMYRKFFDYYADALNCTTLTDAERKAFMLAIAFNLQDEYGEEISGELLPVVTEEDVKLFIARAKSMWEKLRLMDEWFDYLNEQDDDAEPLARIEMLEELYNFVLENGVDKIPASMLWKKALTLSEKHGYPFCRDFLPELDYWTCVKLGQTYAELTSKTISYEEWRNV